MRLLIWPTLTASRLVRVRPTANPNPSPYQVRLSRPSLRLPPSESGRPPASLPLLLTLTLTLTLSLTLTLTFTLTLTLTLTLATLILTTLTHPNTLTLNPQP